MSVFVFEDQRKYFKELLDAGAKNMRKKSGKFLLECLIIGAPGRRLWQQIINPSKVLASTKLM